MAAFQQTPAVVFPFLNEIDLFPIVLSHISSPEVSCLPIKRESPGIPQPQGENLRLPPSLEKRIIRRDGIGEESVYIDPKKFPEEVLGVLSAVVRIAA